MHSNSKYEHNTNVRLKSAFTLIELLVVIAIIAILAAILFPVFAQARAKARQATCISNNKQMSLATLMYSQDYDELFPFGYGNLNGHWWQSGGVPFVGDTPWNWRSTSAAAQSLYGGYWANAILPYTKNLQVVLCPDAATTLDLGGTPNGVATRLKVSLAYNGLLQGYSQAGMAVPAQLPMAHEGLGKGNLYGYQSPNPFLECASDNQPCSYIPNTGEGCSPTKNGTMSGWFGFIGSAYVHSGGMVFVYCDGHAKWKRLGGTADVPTNPYIDPYRLYDSAGFPYSQWWDGCQQWFWRPDYTYPNS